MKLHTTLMIGLIASLSLQSATAQRRPGGKNGLGKKNSAERAAMREEFRLDRKDTHGNQAEPGADHRPEDLFAYHTATMNRITALLRTGKITVDQGTQFKLAHTEATVLLKEAKDQDNLTNGRKTAIRNDLNQINDSINEVVEDGEKEENRTPTLNIKQHRFEEAIEFGERSGRLSSGKASTLRRKLESLSKLEDRLKSGSGLSERERVRLHEEAIDIRKDLVKELSD